MDLARGPSQHGQGLLSTSSFIYQQLLYILMYNILAAVASLFVYLLLQYLPICPQYHSGSRQAECTAVSYLPRQQKRLECPGGSWKGQTSCISIVFRLLQIYQNVLPASLAYFQLVAMAFALGQCFFYWPSVQKMLFIEEKHFLAYYLTENRMYLGVSIPKRHIFCVQKYFL